MVARHGLQRGRAVGGDVCGAFGEVRADVGHGRCRRGESDAPAGGVETAAHQRRIVPPPPFVAARDFDCKSFFVHVLSGPRGPDAAPDRFGGPCADYFSVKIIQLSCNAKFICAPPGREC